jgi:hypothetical protein
MMTSSRRLDRQLSPLKRGGDVDDAGQLPDGVSKHEPPCPHAIDIRAPWQNDFVRNDCAAHDAKSGIEQDSGQMVKWPLGEPTDKAELA